MYGLLRFNAIYNTILPSNTTSPFMIQAFLLAHVRQIVLDKVDGDAEQPRKVKIHNSLTTDGVSMPVLAKGKKTIPLSTEPTRKQITEVLFWVVAVVLLRLMALFPHQVGKYGRNPEPRHETSQGANMRRNAFATADGGE